MKKNLPLLLILLGLAFMSNGQTITWVTPEISSNVQQACETETVTVKFTSDADITDGVVTVALPTGYEYVDGSATIAGGTLDSVDNTDPSNPKFTVDALENQQVTITLQETATCAAAETGTQEITASIADSQGTQLGSDSPPKTVTINNPILNLLSVSNSVSSLATGETVTRTATISNGGFGSAKYITLYDEFDEGVFTVSNASNGGTITTSTAGGKTTAAIQYDLTADELEQNEQLVLTYDLTLVTCDATTPFPSVVNASWGCSLGESCALSNSRNTSVNLTPVDQPNLVFDFPAKYTEDGCWDTAITKTGTITNNGTGIATGVTLDFGPSVSNSNTNYAGPDSRTIDPASIEITSSTGDPVSITIDNVSTASNSSMTCDPTSSQEKVLKVETSLPDIAPGETITITWKEYVCPIGPQCTDSIFTIAGLLYEYSYKDECGKNDRSSSAPIRAYSYKSVSIGLSPAIDGPIDYNDGDTGTILFPIDYSSLNLYGDLPDGTQIYLEVEMPDDFSFCGDDPRLLSTTGGQFTNGNAPASIETDPTNPKIKRVYFDDTDGALGIRANTQLAVDICASCGTSGSREIKISWGIRYPAGVTCGTFPHTYDCQAKQVVLHCPDCSGVDDYVKTNGINVERTNYGTVDANNDYEQDNTNTVLKEDAQSKRMMNKDEVEYSVKGDAKVTNGIDKLLLDLTHTGVESTVLNNWNFTGGTIEVTSGGTTTSYPLSAPTRAGNIDTFDLSSIAGFPTIQDGDTFDVKPTYKLDVPHNDTYKFGDFDSQQIVTEGFLYGEDISGNELICGDTYSDYMNILELYTTIRNTASDIVGCEQPNYSRVLSYVSSGPCCNNYNGVQFSGEYRDLMELKELELIIPSDLEWDTGYLQTSTPDIGKVDNVQPTETTNSDGDTVLTFDVTQMTTDDGVPVTFDLGTVISLYYKLRPKCGITGSFTRTITANHLYEFRSTGEQFTRTWDTTQSGNAGDAELQLSSTQTYDASSNTANWTLDVNSINATAGVGNVWLYIDETNSDITVTDLIVDGSTVTRDANGFYQLGDLSKKSGTDDEFAINIDAEFTECTPRALPVTMGFSCEGYPTDIASACTKETLNLEVAPEPSQIQTSINIPAGVDQCQPFEVEYRIVSSKIAEIKDLNVLFDFTGTGGTKGFDYVAGSAEIKYPANAAFVSVDAAAENKLLAYNAGSSPTVAIDAQDLMANPFATNDQTLGGQGSAPANELVVKMELIAGCDAPRGTRLGMTPYANRPCGDAAEGNSVKVFSDPIRINGLPDPYESELELTIADEIDACRNTASVAGEYSVSGAETSAGDREFKVTIPSGTTYEGNLACTSTDCVTMTGETVNGDGSRELTFQLPVGYETTPTSESIKFTFDIGLATVDQTCGNSNNLEISGYRTIEGATCGASNCPDTDVDLATATKSMTSEKPQLVGELNNYTYGNGSTHEFDLEVTNNGSFATEENLIVEFYCKKASGTETYLTGNDVTIPSSIAANGGVYTKTDVSIVTGAGNCTPQSGDEIIAKIKETTEGGQSQCACSDMTATSASPIILPIKLASFEAERQDCNAVLTWVTGSEDGGVGFDVQKSTDGISFTTIANISANGFGSTYQYIDENLQGTAYYKLVIINDDAENDSSDILQLDSDCDKAEMILIPNPVTDNGTVVVQGTFSDNAEVQLIDINGRVVMAKGGLSVNGRITLSSATLDKGIYIVRVKDGNTVVEQKLIVQ